MPLYEYKCDKCGKVIEVRQRFSDEPLKIHEDCGGNLERLISMSAFQLKGSGWYATDYKSSSSSAKSESSKTDSGSASTETKSDTKTESKPAETTTADKSKPD